MRQEDIKNAGRDNASVVEKYAPTRMLERIYNHTGHGHTEAGAGRSTDEGGGKSLTALSPSIFAKLSYFCRTNDLTLLVS